MNTWLLIKVYEKRAPALTKEPVQALVLGFLFVFSEVLFAIGLFPETAKELTKKIDERKAVYVKSLEEEASKVSMKEE